MCQYRWRGWPSVICRSGLAFCRSRSHRCDCRCGAARHRLCVTASILRLRLLPSGTEVGGTLLGAAAGGLIGSTIGSGSGRLAATAAGTLIGAAVGGSIGHQANYSGFAGTGFERGASRIGNNYYTYHDRAAYYQSGEIPSYTPGGYIYRGDPGNSAYLIGQGPVVPNTIQNNVFSVPAVQYQYPAYREVVWQPVSDVTVYRQGTAPLSQHGCSQVNNPGGRVLHYCPDRFGGWSLRP